MGSENGTQAARSSKWVSVWFTDHNGVLAFGSRPVQPTKLQMRGDGLVI